MSVPSDDLTVAETILKRSDLGFCAKFDLEQAKILSSLPSGSGPTIKAARALPMMPMEPRPETIADPRVETVEIDQNRATDPDDGARQTVARNFCST